MPGSLAIGLKRCYSPPALLQPGLRFNLLFGLLAGQEVADSQASALLVGVSLHQLKAVLLLWRQHPFSGVKASVGEWDSGYCAVAAHGMAMLAAFRPQIDGEEGASVYIMADVIVPSLETMALVELLVKFDRENHYNENEARYIFTVEGVFDFGPEGGGPFTVMVSAGDFIFVPSGMYNWFTLTEVREIKAIRLFEDTKGWMPHYR